MNDAEKQKLEALLRQVGPVVNKLADPPAGQPDRVRDAFERVLNEEFPLAAQPASEPAEPVAVRRTVVEQEKAEPSWLEVWRWWIGLATATAAVVLVLVLNRPGPNLPPVIQVAMLDSVGTVRGTGEKPMDVLKRQWKDAKPLEFDDAGKLKQWQADWPAGSKQTVVKILYNRDAGELRVTVQTDGALTSEKVFPVREEGELPKLMMEIEVFMKGKLN